MEAPVPTPGPADNPAGAASADARSGTLTPAERTVRELLRAGSSPREIAAVLGPAHPERAEPLRP